MESEEDSHPLEDGRWTSGVRADEPDGASTVTCSALVMLSSL